MFESIILFDSETWTLTKQMTIRMDGCYTKHLRYLSYIKFNTYADIHVRNVDVYEMKDNIRLHEYKECIYKGKWEARRMDLLKLFENKDR